MIKQHHQFKINNKRNQQMLSLQVMINNNRMNHGNIKVAMDLVKEQDNIIMDQEINTLIEPH